MRKARRQRCVPRHAALAEQHELPEAAFRRVDEWRFVDLDVPPTSAELQLRHQFERVFSNAQYSSEYTCLAREYGNFYVKHGGLPEESLAMRMMGCCGAAAAGNWHIRTYYSDGTIDAGGDIGI